MTRVLPLLGLAALVLLASAGPAVAAAATAGRAPLTVDLTIDGQRLSRASTAHPLRLRDEEDVTASISVSNHSTETVAIQTVRLDGRVAGLVFFGYLARVDLRVAPGATVTRPVSFDFGGLAAQATGFVVGRVRLVAADGTTLTSVPFHADVRGRVTSVYGLFAIVVALITVLLVVSAVLRMVGGTLAANRWNRAVRLAICGAGVAMTITLAAPAMRLVSVSTRAALLACGLGAAVGFAVGYLSPTPGRVRSGEDEAELPKASARA